jgi:hypothetical protein
MDGVGAQGLMVKYAGEDVTFSASSRVKTLGQNLIAPLSRAGLSEGNGSRGTYSRRRCARSTGDENAEK